MEYTFQCHKALKLLELDYHVEGKEVFHFLFNNFLDFYKVEKPTESIVTFESAINCLNSISFIMVEKFLCVYHCYYRKNKPDNFSEYDYYVLDYIHDYEQRNAIIKVKFGFDNVFIIKLNENNIFYSPNSRFFSFFENLFKKPQNNKKCFINLHDLAIFYKEKEAKKYNSDEARFELQKKFKRIVGKKIENNYTLY